MNFKKKICILTLPLLLASCGMNEKPDDVLMKNQQKVVGIFSKITSEVSKSESNGKAKIGLLGKQGDINFDLDYKFQIDSENKKSGGNIVGKIEGKGDNKSNITFDLDLVNTEKNLYVKLNKADNFDAGKLLPIDTAALKGILSSAVNKWFFIENQPNNSLDFNRYSQIIEIIKKYQLFKSVKQNEDKEFYNYDVTINGDNYVKMLNDLSLLTDKKELTKEIKDQILKDVTKADFKGNLKINPRNKEYFIFTSVNKDSTLKIENSKKLFNINVSEGKDSSFDLSVAKDGGTLNGKVSTKQAGKEVSKGEFVLKIEKNKYALNGKMEELNSGGSTTFDITLNQNKSTKNDIVEPTGAQDLQKFIMSMMGLGAQQDNNSTTGTGITTPQGTPKIPANINTATPPVPTNTEAKPKQTPKTK